MLCTASYNSFTSCKLKYLMADFEHQTDQCGTLCLCKWSIYCSTDTNEVLLGSLSLQSKPATVRLTPVYLLAHHMPRVTDKFRGPRTFFADVVYSSPYQQVTQIKWGRVW